MTGTDEHQWFDLALAYDPVTRKVDLVLGEDGDLVPDFTPVPAMLITIGTDRRARPDDTLPSGVSEINAPTSFVERRGWAGDALDARGEGIGVRLWLLDREKQTDLVPLMAREWLKEGFKWVEREGFPAAEIEVAWVRPGWLGYRVKVAGRSASIVAPVGA